MCFNWGGAVCYYREKMSALTGVGLNVQTGLELCVSTGMVWYIYSEAELMFGLVWSCVLGQGIGLVLR